MIPKCSLYRHGPATLGGRGQGGIFAGWVLVFASATTSFVTHSVIGGARLIYMPQFVYREVGVLFQWPMAAAISFLLLVSTGAVMIALTLLARHRRLAAYA